MSRERFEHILPTLEQARKRTKPHRVDMQSSLKNPLQAPSAVGDSGTALKDDHPIARIQARKNAIQRSSQCRL